MQLKVGKSPGIVGIPAEAHQYRGEEVRYRLQDLFINFGRQGLYHRTLGVQSLSLYKKNKKNKEKYQTVQAIESSPSVLCGQHLRSLLAGEPRTQKLKYHLLRTHGSKVLPLKSGSVSYTHLTLPTRRTV